MVARTRDRKRSSAEVSAVDLQCFVVVVGAGAGCLARQRSANLCRWVRSIAVRCSTHGDSDTSGSTSEQAPCSMVLVALGLVSVWPLAAQLPAEVMSSV